MKRIFLLVALIAFFAIAFASLSHKATQKQKLEKKPVEKERTCAYRSACMSY